MKLLIFILFLVSSCGLETVNFLPNPQVVSQTEGGLLVWSYDPGVYTGTNFLGYEIFYKYYVENVSLNYGAIDSEALRTSGGVAVVPTPERLVSLGYQRVNLNEFVLSNEPLIQLNSADIGKNLRFEIDFRDLLSASPLLKQGSPPVLRITDTSGPPPLPTPLFKQEIRRGARSATGVYFRRFWEVYDHILRLQQPNLEPHLVSALTGNPSGIWIVFFVMAYGWSPEGGREVSEPVLLGTVRTFTLTWQ